MIQQKIKLCIIVPNLQCGGSEKFISILCNHINTAVFEVELFILDGEAIFFQITNPSVKIVRLQIKNVRKSLPAILNIIKKSNPDLLFIAANHLNIFVCVFKFLFPKKLKLITRESSIVSINNKRSKYGELYEKLVKTFYKNVDFIFCQSDYMQNDLIKNYKIKKEKTIVIYNPVEEVITTEISTRFSVSEHKFLTVGRLSAEKGIERILRALSLLTIDFKYYIIGSGKEKNKLSHLIHELNLTDKVFFEEEKHDPYQNMSNADLFLLGSYYEGLPNVLLEAGMLGIPVVVYNSPGGISEIIVDGSNGFLANADVSDKVFADTIARAVNYKFNKKKIIQMTKDKFSANKIISQIENSFKSIYNNNQPI